MPTVTPPWPYTLQLRLHLVRACADSWGAAELGRSGGKVLWAECR